ncbi:MAG: hypothetical protein MK180_12480 [Rhodobacteraceae bacterium]|nr:hypothetical protein [Paracoccaceae bacterium]
MAETSDDIAEYEERLQSALGRIAAGMAKWPDAAAPAEATQEMLDIEPEVAVAPEVGEVEKLNAELEDERTANAQLNQRVRQIKTRHGETVAELEEQLAAALQRAEAAEQATEKVRRTSEEMRKVMGEIEAAAQDGAVDAHLINRAMMAELEAMRAERSADAAEIADIMSALAPLVEEEVANA